jgi:hypothetical protein
MYDEVVKQGVPDHFSDLLSQLDSSSKPKDTDDDKSAG